MDLNVSASVVNSISHRGCRVQTGGKRGSGAPGWKLRSPVWFQLGVTLHLPRHLRLRGLDTLLILVPPTARSYLVWRHPELPVCTDPVIRALPN